MDSLLALVWVVGAISDVQAQLLPSAPPWGPTNRSGSAVSWFGPSHASRPPPLSLVHVHNLLFLIRLLSPCTAWCSQVSLANSMSHSILADSPTHKA